MSAWDTSFPPVLRELHKLAFGDGIEFEPYAAFLASGETADWFSHWTGNAQAAGAELRVFGQDGSGGLAAFWIVEPRRDILKQPVVFLGSEGQRGVIAVDFDNYLWLLAGGVGPCEVIVSDQLEGTPQDSLERFARTNSTVVQTTPAQIVAEARRAYPGFEPWVASQCR